ncbi:MAG: transporter substrate-binding domain-containing protein, partial [Erysipelotrichaceae bacterium]|nr:transporter substrate-binding domain-containing protein [Erysipelotrichaceae bacterium]
NAYAKNAQVLVMKKERLDEVKSEEDMKNIQIAVENGGSAMGLLEEMGITNYLAVYDQATAMMEVAAGKSDACVVDITMANALCAEGKSYADMGYVIELSKEEYGIGFRKDSDLCDAVNDLLNKYMEDGTMQQLSEKYDVALAE